MRKAELATSTTPGAKGIVERWLPDYADRFVFEPLAKMESGDCFEVESDGVQVLLRGVSGVSQASALYWFLKNHCNCHISWESAQLKLPATLPKVASVHIESPYSIRYYFNYCTFSYSLPFWDWSRWEREIDWMALHGINAPLSVTGQEAIWRTVYRRFGLSDAEINEFLVGAAYLPFGWMGCIDGWAGPLPAQWFDDHLALQQKIVARQRELGMTPILQGFTGHVPPALAKHFSDCKVHQLSSWAGFPPTYFLDAFDPLFEEIGHAFLEEQHSQFGTDHLYAADTFIEMRPASNDPTFLADLAKSIYGGMTGADPEAVWVLQSWPFYYERDFWGPTQIRAFLEAVPNERMLILDLYAENFPYWQQTHAYHGKPWVWSMLHNFGGRPGLHGRFANVAANPPAALHSPQRGNLVGIGISTEAIENNPAQYELLTEMIWRDQPLDIDMWIEEYATRRYGMRLEATNAAWHLLVASVYNRGVQSHGMTPSIIAARPSLNLESGWRRYEETKTDLLPVTDAWRLLLTCADQVGEIGGYRRDLVDVSAHALTLIAERLHTDLVHAFDAGDRDHFQSLAGRFLMLITDLDALLATRQEYLLGQWISSARRHGTTATEKAHLEWNARNLVTLWGSKESRLHDYSCRYWSGLVNHFYLVRWQLFVEEATNALQENRAFDAEEFDARVKMFEEGWTHQSSSLPVEAIGDTIAIARQWYEKYGAFVHSEPNHC